MQTLHNIIIPGAAGKPIALDLYLDGEPEAKPLVIYAHGFNGFKTWGNFSLPAEKMVANAR
jgi:uncharacterized protein